MSKKEPVSRPQEELLGRSTPFNARRLLIIYGVLAAAIVITAVFFTLNGVMDTLQILLTVLTAGCVIFGVRKALMDKKRETILYETWFQCGKDSYTYDELTEVTRQRDQVFFRNGRGAAHKHSFYAGNAQALAYLLEKKRKEAKRQRQQAKGRR